MHLRAFAAILLAFFFTIGGIARGADVRRDGNWWNGLSRVEKPPYATGFFDGTTYRVRTIYMSASLFPSVDLPPECDASRPRAKAVAEGCYKIAGAVVASMNKFAKEVSESDEREFSRVTAGSIVDGLDKIYSDYRNRRIGVIDAITVVLESISGSSDERIAKRLEFLRKEASEK